MEKDKFLKNERQKNKIMKHWNHQGRECYRKKTIAETETGITECHIINYLLT